MVNRVTFCHSLRILSLPMKKSLALIFLIPVLLVACNKPETDKVLEIKDFTTVMKTGEGVVDPEHGKETAFYYGALGGQNGANANGVGYIHTFEDGFSTVTANLNIQVADKGFEYVAYLEGATSAAPIKVGALHSIIGDVRHSVKFETNEGVTSKLKLVVYREGSGKKEVVAVGDLKQPSQP